jgi:hypothetical protein
MSHDQEGLLPMAQYRKGWITSRHFGRKYTGVRYPEKLMTLVSLASAAAAVSAIASVTTIT